MARFGDPLTGRELQVAALIATGASKAVIRRQLGLSHEMVKYVVRTAFTKTGTPTRCQLLLLLFRTRQLMWLGDTVTIPGLEAADSVLVTEAGPARFWLQVTPNPLADGQVTGQWLTREDALLVSQLHAAASGQHLAVS
jgi:DNA-binding CsgD family transcriptional regulator